MDDLLHLLDASEISEHISDRDDVTVGDQILSDFFGRLDGTGPDGLYDVSAVISFGLLLTLDSKPRTGKPTFSMK